MHWYVTARREFDRLITARGTLLYGVIFVIAGILYTNPPEPATAALGPATTIGALQRASYLVIPVGGVLLGYGAISKERESGTITFTAGVPQSRWAILIGVFAGRFAVLSVATLVAYVIIAIIGSLGQGMIPLLSFIAFTFIGLVFLASNVAIAVGLSAVTKRSIRAATVAFVYLVLAIFWVTFSARLIYQALFGTVVNPFNPPADPVLFLLQRVSPTGAFRTASNWLLGIGNSASSYEAVVIDADPAAPRVNAYRVSETFSGDIPVYLQPEMGPVILILWCVGMITLGYLGFRRTDLV